MSKPSIEQSETQTFLVFTEDDAIYGVTGALIGGTVSVGASLLSQAEHAKLIEVAPGGQKLPDFSTGELASDATIGVGGGFIVATLIACGVRKAVDNIRHKRDVKSQVQQFRRQLDEYGQPEIS